MFQVNGEQVIFNLDKEMKRPREIEEDSSIGDIDLIKNCVLEVLQEKEENELKNLLVWAENENWELEESIGPVGKKCVNEESDIEKSDSYSSMDEHELAKE